MTPASRYEHHDYPIPVHHRWSWQAASAARAVQDVASDTAFFEYASDLYLNQSQYSLDLFADLADERDLDPSQFRTAAKQETYRPMIEADRETGSDMGVRGTPSVFVNKERIETNTVAHIAAAIEAAR